MPNRYLSTVSYELDSSIEKLKILKIVLNDFVKDFPFIEDLNGAYPSPVLMKAVQSVEDTVTQIGLVNDYVKELNV